ncbi:MAG: hypothetical protein AAF927_01760 [Bacteroidota bacterium]
MKITVIVKYHIIDPSNVEYRLFREDGSMIENKKVVGERVPLGGISSNVEWMRNDVHRLTDEIKSMIPQASEINYEFREYHRLEEIVTNTAKDLAKDFLTYDRKDDENLSESALDDLIRSGKVSIEEICLTFKAELEEWMGYKSPQLPQTTRVSLLELAVQPDGIQYLNTFGFFTALFKTVCGRKSVKITISNKGEVVDIE